MAGEPGRVVVVGDGPAGMALAYLLARRGVPVTVLEAHQDFARAFRGEGVQRSGIDAFGQMGLAEEFDRLPHTELRMIESYFDGRLVARTDAARLGRAQVRAVPQPAMLQLLADQACKYPSFRLEFGVTVRDLLREGSRVVGVRASASDGPREYRADLVVGADGRNAATRKHSGLGDLSGPRQGFDILWLKVPYPDGYPDRATALAAKAADRNGGAYPTADGQIQVGFVIPKGGFGALRARGADKWTEELIGAFPTYLADQLRAHREAVASATLLDVVSGRLTEWTAPGILLLGDAAHPMSPVGGQGLNIALRDALVAANHLVPVLTAGSDPSAIDAAARRVRDERWPEIVAVQDMQQNQAHILLAPDGWRTRLMNRLLPWLVRTGLLQWLQRREYQVMSEGAVQVRLVVLGAAILVFQISKSHRGLRQVSLAVRCGFTPVRVVCANTLAMAHANNASKLIRLKHTKDVLENLANVREIMDLANAELEATAEQYWLLARKSINQNDLRRYVKKVFKVEDDQDTGTRMANIMEEVMGLAEAGRGNTLPSIRGTYWSAYNGVSEWLTHSRGRSDDNRLNSLWFGNSALTNRHALEVALDMAC